MLFWNRKLILNEFGYYELAEKPSPEDLEKYYREQYYQHNSGNYNKNLSDMEKEWLRCKTLEKIHVVRMLSGKQSGKFLDVGCGQGWALRFFSEEGYDVFGMDYSIEGLRAHNSDFADCVVQGDLSKHLSQLSEKYDVIMMENVLEHIIDPQAILESLANISHEGTVLIVVVPNDFSVLQTYLQEKGYIDRPFWVVIPDHISYFNIKGLRRLAEHCSWKVRKILTDFPIDINLLNPDTNYVMHSNKGRAAHQARMELELLLHAQKDMDSITGMYENMANLGLGRNIIAFMQLQDPNKTAE